MTSYVDNNEATNATQLTTPNTAQSAASIASAAALNLNINTIGNDVILVANETASPLAANLSANNLVENELTSSMATATTPTSLPLAKKLAALPLEDFYIDSSHIINTTNGGNYSNNLNDSSLAGAGDNYDCDSLSDGHEKTDTTPENLNKKIDDIIHEQNQNQKHQHHHPQLRHHHPNHYHENLAYSSNTQNSSSPYKETEKGIKTTATNSSLSSPPSSAGLATSHIKMEPGLVGLAAAIDDSNAKYCYATRSSPKHRLDKDTFWTNSSVGSEQEPSEDVSTSPQFKANNSIVENDNNDGSGGIQTTKTHPMNHRHHPQQQHEEVSERQLSGRGGEANSEAIDKAEDDDLSSSVSTSAATKTSSKSCAFTIDHFNEKDSDPAATAAKYKNMLERFQSRHRRGSSLAKMESSEGNANANGKKTLTSSSSASPLTSVHSSRPNSSSNRDSGDFSQMENLESSPAVAASASASPASTANAPAVKMRVRDRSTSRVRDASKRHSWSPRSSTNEQNQNALHSAQQVQQANAAAQKKNIATPPSSNARNIAASSAGNAARSKANILSMPKAPSSGIATRTQFVPRSTVMQLALQKVDFMCPEPPLADFQHLNMDADNLSDTGTYTLDGDNYTEEQKDLMNIDKSNRQAALNEKLRPRNLRLKKEHERTSIPPSSNKKATNVLEVNYYHHEPNNEETTPSKQILSPNDLILGPHQTAGAYLDKIKSRVLRNMPPNSGKNCDLDLDMKRNVSKTLDEDFGCFTSVTKSGILAKQSALDSCPKLTRRGSLSTSQIDSSEYVSNEAKMKNLSAQVYPGGSFTDHQKSEYCFNIFNNKNNVGGGGGGGSANVGNGQERFAATRSMIESPPETPSSKVRPVANLSDTAALKNAQSKNDWIQEWARNARARSLATESTTKARNSGLPNASGLPGSEDLMTRSYTCSDTGCSDSLTDDNIYNNQLKKSLAARHRLLGGGGNGDCDYSSDPSLCSTYAKSPTELNSGTAYKPPKSPTKIPSPLHTLGRARSASRARPVLQNILSPDGEEDDRIYLEKTAAAINNLQESLSRKGSIKSPSHIVGYRGQQAILTPEECSPHNSIGSPTIYRRSPAHRRNLSNDGPFIPTHRDLMTSSINEQQLQMLTSGEYLVKQMRIRKNSFDGSNIQAGNSPARRAALKTLQQQYQQQNQQHQHQQVLKNQVKDSGALSPLRRSSSFSTKILDQQQQQQQSQRQRAARPQFQNIYTPPAARHLYGLSTMASNNGHAITKSASSNSFRQMYSDYDESQQYYINDEDEDENLYVEDYYSSDPEEEPTLLENANVMSTSSSANTGPLPNTRVNKALLMRMELNKQKIAGVKPTSAPAGGNAAKIAALAAGGGVMACPNTPEVPRRNIKSAPRTSLSSNRQSMPRDVSLSHLATQVPNSLASAKKQLLQTAASAMPRSSSTSSQQRVQPKYLDISKYKPAQSNNFLRKNDTRSTLRTPSVDPSKRNSTGGSGGNGFTRTDPSRTSNRSVRSMGPGMSTSASGCLTGNNNRAMSATRRDISVSKQKETEMAMWKRRSTYDPMKAAMEDRRRKEEAKLLAKQQQLANKSMNSDNQQALSESDATPRSQRSYSSGSQQNSLDQALAACMGDPDDDLNDEDLECVF